MKPHRAAASGMDLRRRHALALRPTLRQLMIVVGYAAVVSALAAPLLRSGATPIERWTATLLVPLSPPLLAMLILLFDRPTPSKYWLVGLLASLFGPLFVLWYDALSLAWSPGGGLGRVPLVVLVVLNLLMVASLARLAKRLLRRCPDCERRSLLPVGRLLWCASCGLKLPKQ
jgi:hypothetical protein